MHPHNTGDTVAILVGRRTCDLHVAGSISGWAPLRRGLGQATYSKQHNLVPAKGVISLTWKVTAGLVKSNGSLVYHRGFMTITCGLTAKKLGSAPCPALGIEYVITLPTYS